MATWRDFTLDSVQTAIFTPDHTSFSSAKAVAIVLAKFQGRFDGDMQVVPLPSEVPPELPHVQLQSSDGRWRLSMAPARIDSYWRNAGSDSQPSLGGVVVECAEVLERYVQESHVRVARVAMVIIRTTAVDDPAQALIKRFCNDASQRTPFNRSAAFEIHNHKEYRPRRDDIVYAINSWVRCKAAKRVTDDKSVILVHQDLNTLVTEMESRRFAPEEIHAFFQMAAVESDDILRNYFPG